MFKIGRKKVISFQSKKNLASLARENGLPSRFRARRVDNSVEKEGKLK